jgi:hypothetical protein
LAKQGLENPYEKLCGRLTLFMSARSKVIESGDVSFYSQSTSKVAQRALRESNEDSNEGVRENDVITKARRTKERQGRVHGASNKLT